MVARVVSLAIAAGAALIAGCVGSAKPAASPTGVAATATTEVTRTAPAATSTAPFADASMPRHVMFAPGEIISADGQAGIFFLDPKTGAAEAWTVPASTLTDPYPVPFSFWVSGLSADGGKVVYTCLEPKVGSIPVPCGGGVDHVWYLLDTRADQRTRVTAFSGPFLSISPDGKTLLGATADGFALADVTHSGTWRSVSLPPGSDMSYPRVDWSPDGARLVLTTGSALSALNTFLVDTTRGSASALNSAWYGGAWSPDGARLVMWKRSTDNAGEFRMLDRDGRLVWSKPAASGGTRGTWSADGSLLYAEVQDGPQAPGSGPLNRMDVLDGSTGATRYRVRGAYCPLGWVGGTHRLLTESYGFGEALVDLPANDLKLFDVYARPMPFDANIAILFDGDFRSYDLTTRATKLIAHTTVTPAWDTNHGALFAGDRLVFTALHLGHGGCGEGNGPQNPPRPELFAGPFADDAPVTRGPGL